MPSLQTFSKIRSRRRLKRCRCSRNLWRQATWAISTASSSPNSRQRSASLSCTIAPRFRLHLRFRWRFWTSRTSRDGAGSSGTRTGAVDKATFWRKGGALHGREPTRGRRRGGVQPPQGRFMEAVYWVEEGCPRWRWELDHCASLSCRAPRRWTVPMTTHQLTDSVIHAG